MADAETETTAGTPTAAKPADAFYRPAAVLGHEDGVVLRVKVRGEDVDVLVAGPHKGQVLNTLSHSLSDGDLASFRALLGRQSR